jgi:hypothetical protein
MDPRREAERPAGIATESRTIWMPIRPHWSETMTRRDVAFLLAALGSGAGFFGAMVGQGMLGSGLLFGLGGPGSVDIATLIGIVSASVGLVAAVALMFARDTRRLGRVVVGAAVIGGLACGGVYILTAVPAILGGLIATRVDPSRPLA